MKRILQFGMTPNYGGVEAFIMNIYRSLNHNEIQFDFWVNSNEKIAYEEEILKLGGRVIRSNFYSRKKHFFKHYGEIINYFKNNKDVIAIHINKANIRDIDLLLIAYLMKIPVRIIHSHIANISFKMGFMERINKNIISIISTNLLACSQDAGKYMFGNYSFDIVKDAVNIDIYKFNNDNRKKIRQEYNIDDDCFLVGSIGRFCEQKNTLFIIDIFREIKLNIPNSKLILIGSGHLKDELVEKIKKAKVEDSVILTGEVLNVNEYYSSMDVFLFPSLYEGFGMVLLEAQISGLTCIASKDVIPQEVNVTNEIKWVSLNQDANQWAESVCKYKGVKRYNKIGCIKSNGFDIKDVVKKMKNIYLKIGE